MSMIDSTLETSERSSILDESTLNSNIILSKLNESQAVTEESTIQNQSNENLNIENNLSITLDQSEKELLSNQKIRKDSLIDASERNRNNSFENTAGTVRESSCVRVFSESLQDNEEAESIISVEEDDGDDVVEISALESTNNVTPEKEIMSYSQPKQMDIEIEKLNARDEQDEDELFQYPFIEVGRRLWTSSAEKQSYTKGCLWSPDGTCLLVPVHLDGMHIIELPTDLYTSYEIPQNRNLSKLSSAVHVKEGGTVYDFCWYPYMTSTDPATCLWLATRQHEPIHMWDAFTGNLRCSYRGYDEVDEVESAISIIFSSDAKKILGGYKKNIKVFDTNIPGRDYSTIAVKQAVSCFALTTDNNNSVTAGSWAGYINHYDLRAPKLGPLFTLGGHSGGITWLKYSPYSDQNWYLFSGARKDNKILQWDMRNYSEPIQIFERNVQTNQRIYYDLTPLNKWLASGDTEGILRIWNLGDRSLQFELPLHQDCCNGVSFHPSLPIISTTSGQFHFVDVADSDDKPTEKIVNYENSLLILWYGSSIESTN